VSRNEGGSRTPLFAFNCGSIHMITWISIQSMWSKKEMFNFGGKKNESWIWTLKLLIEQIHSDYWNK